MSSDVTTLEGLHVTGQYRNRSMQHTLISEAPRSGRLSLAPVSAKELNERARFKVFFELFR
jgi:Holliday junction resolvasome RuvABC ATP-dependent DNA helicase subunit